MSKNESIAVSASANCALAHDGGADRPAVDPEGAERPGPRPQRARAWKDLLWFFLVLAILPTHHEFLICGGVVAVVAVAFYFRYYPREWLLFLTGSILGLVFEIGGDAIYKLQSWSEGSLFGIPAWLPLFWGLGFVFFRRFGNVLVGLEEKRGANDRPL